MSQSVSPVPNGNPAVSPYLLIRGASDAIAFYAKVFGATEHFRLTAPDGRIGHAEIEIAGSRLMIADEHPEMDFLGPQSRGGTTVSLLIYVEDVDAVFVVKDPGDDKTLVAIERLTQAGFHLQPVELGARALELNLERSQGSHYFHESRLGPASEVVPVWVEEMLG